MEPALSVLIPTRNRQATLKRTVEGYLRHGARVSFEIVVVDDGSEDGTGEYLRAAAAGESRLRVLGQEHAGPAQARNRAISEARGRYLLLAGDDTRPVEGLLDGHVAAHERPHPPRFVLGRIEWDPERPITPVMRHVTGFGGQQFRYDFLRDHQRLGFKYFYGSSLSLRRDVAAHLPGPFDPAFGDAALEDVDLGYRLMGTRRDIEYRAGLRAWHDHPYDVAGFAKRQYRVGLSTATLFSRHPEVAPEYGASEVAGAVRAAAAAPARGRVPMAPAEVAVAERSLLESLARVEDRGHRWQQRVYLGLFWYFQAKGMVETQAETAGAAPALGVLMGRALTCSLRSALREPDRRLPADVRTGLEQVCARLERSRGAEGRRAACLRWWLAVRLRELRYALRPRP